MTQQTLPAELLAGDTWTLAGTFADYPAPTWSGVYCFEKADSNFSIAATASGSAYSTTVAASATADYKPGRYYYALLVTKAGERRTADSGYVEILPDPAAPGAVDRRPFAEAALDAIESYLRDPGNLAAANFALGGRSLSRWPRAELLVERDKYRNELRAKVDSNWRNVYTRFR
jgi:hypothetical protein